MSLFDDASLIVTPNGYKAGKLYSIKPFDGSGDFDVTRATGATRVNENGLIELVGNNVPRIDYPPLGGCPSILVEPAATNLLRRSEEFDNAYWGKTNISVTADDAVAPDGTMTAEVVLETNTVGLFRAISPNFSTPEDERRAISVYVKKLNRRYFTLTSGRTATIFGSILFDFDTEEIIEVVDQARARAQNPSIEKLPNGWYRISFLSSRDTSGNLNYHFGFSDIGFLNSDFHGLNEFQGDPTKGGIIWGAQLETGSVATSYIPTVASTVTRAADVINKTGVSSLIGQTEGTLYAEVDIPVGGNTNRIILQIGDGTGVNQADIRLVSNRLRALINSSNFSQIIITSPTNNFGKNKAAITYQNGNASLFVNGVKIGQSTNFTSFSASLNEISVRNDRTNNPVVSFDGHMQALILLPTAITDQQAIALTTL